MNKKIVAAVTAVCVFGAAFLGVALVKNNSGSGLVEENAFRSSNDIASDTVIYFDDEAIALADSSEVTTSLRSEALRAYNYVNEKRAAAGVGALDWNSGLESTSTVRAQEASMKFSHTRPDGSSWYTVNSQIQGGENLAYGFNDAESAMEAWMDSPTHADNILYPDFSSVGISIYVTDDGTYYWAQEFGY